MARENVGAKSDTPICRNFLMQNASNLLDLSERLRGKLLA
jgi:hypothetical protein